MTAPGDDDRLITEARRIAAERRAENRRTREAAAIARTVVEAAAGTKVIEYLRRLADTADVRTPDGGALLWSHVHRVRRGRPVSNQDLAAAYARDPRRPSNAPRPLPIHLTPGGAWFAKILDNPSVRRKLVSPRERAELWERLSDRFARQATGPVRVFTDTAHTKTYLWRRELPILRRNPAVGPEGIVFVHTVSDRIGEMARRALDSPYMRARIQFDRRRRPGYVDPARLNRFRRVIDAQRYLAGIARKVDRSDGVRTPRMLPARRLWPGIIVVVILLCCGGTLSIAFEPVASADAVNDVGGWVIGVIDRFSGETLYDLR
jgi:hypothetical protein